MGEEGTWSDGLLRRELRVQALSMAELATTLEQSEDFPTETPQRLCCLLGTVARAVAAHLDKAPPYHLSAVAKLLQDIGQDLRYVDRSRIAHTPWSMIEATEEFLKRHVGEGTHFILRPQWLFNYSISDEFIAVYRIHLESLDWLPRDSWANVLPEKSYIYCISFPRVQRTNALLHANWGHELGHIIAKRWHDEYFQAFWQGLQPDVKRAINDDIIRRRRSNNTKRRKLEQLDFFEREEESAQEKEALDIAARALTELIADAVGIHLLGVSALMAACEVAVRRDIDEGPLENPSHYPPWRYRLRLMIQDCKADLNVIRKSDEYNFISAHLAQIEQLTQSDKDLATIDKKTRVKLPYDRIAAQWPTIRQQALALLADGSQPYRMPDRLTEITQLVERLRMEVPPNETGHWPEVKPALFEDIISAGWVRKTELDSQSDCTERDRETLCRLVLKGIESSQVHRVFGARLTSEDARKKAK